MSLIKDIWNFEQPIEAAITAKMNAVEQLQAYSPQDFPTFQKERARVECMLRKGPTTTHLALMETTGLPEDVEDAWNVNITLAAITNSTDIGVHNQYRAYVRYTMAIMPSLLSDGVALVNHVFHGPTYSVGDTNIVSPQTGILQTEMNYRTVISIHQNAWTNFQAQNPENP